MDKIKSCGCIKEKSGPDSKSWEGFGEISSTLWSRIKYGAKKRNIPFDLTIEYAWDLFLEQDRKCALTKIDLLMPLKYHIRKNEYNASLDRIDNDKGYIIGNVQWVDKKVNRMKREYTEEEFIEVCRLVAKAYPEKIVKERNNGLG